MLKEGKNPFSSDSEKENLDEQDINNNLNPDDFELENDSEISDEDIKKLADNKSNEKFIKAYRDLQRKMSERNTAYNEATQRAIVAEKMNKILADLANNKQNIQEKNNTQEIQKPVKPIRPPGYSKADAIAYPDSDSGKYDLAIEEYYEKKEQYDEFEKTTLRNQLGDLNKSFEERKNADLQNQDLARRKSALISRLSKKTGGDVRKASEVFEFVQKSMVKDEDQFYIDLYEASLAKNNSNQRKNNGEEITSQRGYRPSAREIVSFNHNLDDKDEQSGFMSEIKNRRANNHSLFETRK